MLPKGFYSFFLTFSIFSLFLGTPFQTIRAQNPIPSFGLPVEGYALFREPSREPQVGEGKRKICIKPVCTNSGDGSETETIVWISTTDLQTSFGPFSIGCGETLQVDIDDRQWQTLVSTHVQTLVSVWIEESTVAFSPSSACFNQPPITPDQTPAPPDSPWLQMTTEDGCLLYYLIY